MKRTEWGLFTVAAGLAVLAFPPFFVELVAIYTLGGIGYLWRILDERGRQRLKDFEKDVLIPYTHEKEGKNLEALEAYKKLALDYRDTPPILPIILGRIQAMEKKLAEKPAPLLKRKPRKRKKKWPRLLK